MAKLCVNIDHVATVRQARLAKEPDPVAAAVICELAGADGITVHLREDRRHIQDRDLYILRKTAKTKLNLEMALTKEIIDIALDVRPDMVTFVPEKRKELTTEGGLNAIANKTALKKVIAKLHDKGIIVSLFIDPDVDQISVSRIVKADYVELHTGKYADATTAKKRFKELTVLKKAAQAVRKAGLGLNAGHGLDYANVASVAAIEGIEDLNIGHSIIARAVLVGLDEAVREMRALIDSALVG
ncbi:MAG: pyridoxine 5'-phosphate synthase [bacterium]